MANADHIVFHVLDVGQGSGNFVGIYEGNNLVSSILIDLGADGTKDWGLNSVDFIYNQLRNMSAPTIDTLILSHSDRDHHNLISALLNYYPIPEQGAPGLVINNVIYGGDRSKYSGEGRTHNTITILEKYCSNIVGGTDFLSSYASSASPLKMVCGNVAIDILVMNTPCAYNDQYLISDNVGSTHQLNTVSAVIVISFADLQYVVTGDATGTTMAACNRIIKQYNLNNTSHLNNVQMMTVPHHGAKKTAFELAGIPKDDNAVNLAKQNVHDFAGNIRAKSITASAGRSANHKHPSAYLLSYFWIYTNTAPLFTEPTIKTGPLHYYTAHFIGSNPVLLIGSDGKSYPFPPSPSFRGWNSIQTSFNIYTNDYCSFGDIKTPNKFIQEHFPPPDNGNDDSNEDSDEEGEIIAEPHHTLIFPPLDIAQSSYINTFGSGLPPAHVIWNFATNSGGHTSLTPTESVKKPKTVHSAVPSSSVLNLPPPSHITATMPPLTVKPTGLDRLQVIV